MNTVETDISDDITIGSHGAVPSSISNADKQCVNYSGTCVTDAVASFTSNT